MKPKRKKSKVQNPPIDDCEDGILAALIKAKEEYVDRIMRGLNALTDDDIEGKLRYFKEKHDPGENATPEEIARFNEIIADIAFGLQELQRTQGNKESLIVSSGQGEDEPADMQGYLHSKLPSNPDLQARLFGQSCKEG